MDLSAESVRIHRFSKRSGLPFRAAQCVYGAGLGLTNAAIGRELNISEDAVKTHMRRVFWTLGAADRANAVLLAAKQGLFWEVS